MPSPTSDVSQLISADGSSVSARIFADEEIYAQEVRRIFERCWLFLGHEDQIPNPGDFFTTFMGETSVIVTRTKEGHIRAFRNRCSHRGMRLCQADSGNTRVFVCPYHAWSFDCAGQLIGIPMSQELYHDRVDKTKHGLMPVAQIDTFKGLIFATFDASAKPLLEYLGNGTNMLGTILDRRAGGTELLGGIHKWCSRSNWKVLEDNNSGDEYHVRINHGSFIDLAKVDLDGWYKKLIHLCAEEGHGCSARFASPDKGGPVADPLDFPELVDPEIRAYYLSTATECEQRLGPFYSRLMPAAGTIFPNFSFVPGFFTIRVIHPRGPREVEIWSYCIVDREAPASVKEKLRHFYQSGFGPAGLFEQDDSVIWEGITDNAKCEATWDIPLNYAMGLGDEHWHEGLGCNVTDILSEATQRSFYRRWRTEMGAAK